MKQKRSSNKIWLAGQNMAVQTLKGLVRGNGRPFIEHADDVAAIVEKSWLFPNRR